MTVSAALKFPKFFECVFEITESSSPSVRIFSQLAELNRSQELRFGLPIINGALYNTVCASPRRLGGGFLQRVSFVSRIGIMDIYLDNLDVNEKYSILSFLYGIHHFPSCVATRFLGGQNFNLDQSSPLALVFGRFICASKGRESTFFLVRQKNSSGLLFIFMSSP